MSGQAKKAPKKALGRGLRALISQPDAPVVSGSEHGKTEPVGTPTSESSANIVEFKKNQQSDDSTQEGNQEGLKYLDVDCLCANANQPRKEFDPEQLAELANSISSLGLIQPIFVRPVSDYQYEIVAGERRWRAAKLANVKQVPVIIKDLGDKETLQIAIVENVQRSNLTVTEEARAYQNLIDEFGLTQREVAEKTGKDRSTIANMLRLLGLPQEVLSLLEEGAISMGHARAILSTKEPSVQKSLAKKCVAENLSVRDLEDIVSRVVVLDKKSKKAKRPSNSDFPEIADRLRKSLGTKVVIKHSKKSGRGKITLEYFSEQELDRLIELIAISS